MLRCIHLGEELMAEPAAAAEKAPITIKKYANRRLYNTATSSYVTLDHLCQMVKDGVDFVVFDAKSGEDITRSVLTQIIVEEESKGGQNLLPIISCASSSASTATICNSSCPAISSRAWIPSPPTRSRCANI